MLKEIGLKVMEGDEAFYYLHQDGELMGAVITHVDDFTLVEPRERSLTIPRRTTQY